EADAHRPQVLLRAAVDDAVARDVHGFGCDGGAEVCYQGDSGVVAREARSYGIHVAEFDAVDGFVGGDVHVGRVGRQLPLRHVGDVAIAVGLAGSGDVQRDIGLGLLQR